MSNQYFDENNLPDEIETWSIEEVIDFLEWLENEDIYDQRDKLNAIKSRNYLAVVGNYIATINLDRKKLKYELEELEKRANELENSLLENQNLTDQKQSILEDKEEQLEKLQRADGNLTI